MARIDLGVEPAHMPNLFSIFMNDSMDTANMEGMLQMADLTPRYGYSIWRQARENADRMGFEADSVGFMEFGNGASQQSITCTAHITQAAMDLVRESSSWLMTHSNYDVRGILEGRGVQGRPRHLLAHESPAPSQGPHQLRQGVRSGKGSRRGASEHRAWLGMAFGLLIVIVLASICQHQFFFRSMITGVFARTALTGALYRRAVHLTPAARRRLPNSAILNHVSTDVSRVDACSGHAAWTAPIQSALPFPFVYMIYLEVHSRPLFLPSPLGPSALAGFALFLLLIPLQERIMVHQCALWQGSMKWTDEKAGTVLEVVASMRVVKSFCYERSFLARLFRIRTQELRDIRNIQHSQSAKRPLSIALAFSLPVLAATLAFVTHTETSNSNKPAAYWPAHGAIEFKDVTMAYRPGLSNVLHGISLKIQAGE
ncbi:hypothetical protein B0H13DRAFT_2349461 [Mycena leptocephala]|nr:hypothetical protein B0H13DRAFT_2349461 [Mycena leptocephala]